MVCTRTSVCIISQCLVRIQMHTVHLCSVTTGYVRTCYNWAALFSSFSTYWVRDKMAATSQKIFSNAFPWMKTYGFRLRFHWIMFPRVHSTIFQHWFRSWLGADEATSHHLNQWWFVYWRIYVSLGLKEFKAITWFAEEYGIFHDHMITARTWNRYNHILRHIIPLNSVLDISSLQVLPCILAKVSRSLDSVE